MSLLAKQGLACKQQVFNALISTWHFCTIKVCVLGSLECPLSKLCRPWIMVINLELIDFGLSPCYLQTCGSSRVQGGVPESTPPYLPFLTKGCPLPHNWVLGFWLHVGERSHPAELSVFPLRTLTESQYSLLSIILGRRKGKDGQSSIAAVNLRPSLDPLAPTAGLIWHWHPKFCLAVLGNERYSQHHPLLLSGILKTEGVRALFFFF